MASHSSLIAPDSVSEALLPLASLSEANFEAVKSLVRAPTSFSPKKEEIEVVADQAQLSRTAIEYLFITLSFLYDHISSELSSGRTYGEAIQSTLNELSILTEWGEQDGGIISTRLKQLLESNEVHKDFKKIERLRAGFYPHAVGFSSLVELRPKFGEDDILGDLIIEGLVPSIMFRITTDAKEGKNHVFQLTEEALGELKKAINRLENKVLAIKNADIRNSKIIEL